MLVLGCSSLSLLGSSTLVTKLHANHVWHIFKCFTGATHHILWLRRWYHHPAVTPRLWHSLFSMTWKKWENLRQDRNAEGSSHQIEGKSITYSQAYSGLHVYAIYRYIYTHTYICAPGMTGSIVSYRTDQEHALWIAETKLVLSLRQI